MECFMGNARKLSRFTTYLFILPMLLFFCVFIIYPVFDVIYLSFFNRSVTGKMTFIGMKNYVDFFTSGDAALAFKNTFIWVFVGVAAKVLLGLLMALVLYKDFKGKRFLTVIILIPYAMPAAVSCTVWRLMYNPNFGIISQVLQDIGFIDKAVSFLGNPSTSLLAVLIVNVWAVAPFCALNILSTLYSIPKDYYEAAQIDGANSIIQFFKITLPIISRDIKTLALLIGIWAFNSFDVIYMMTSGGPSNSSSILVNFVYQNAFEFNKRTYSAAISVVCFIVLMVFAVIYVHSKMKEEEI